MEDFRESDSLETPRCAETQLGERPEESPMRGTLFRS